MEVVRVRNVNYAYARGMELLRRKGVLQDSRAGRAIRRNPPNPKGFKMNLSQEQRAARADRMRVMLRRQREVM